MTLNVTFARSIAALQKHYSITSSARPSSGNGIVSLGDFGVLRLRINSSFVAGPRRPKEHLIPILVQNPQAIGILRHVQSAYIEERPGFHLCAFQIRRDVRNAGERGMRAVLFANAEELNRKLHLSIRNKKGLLAHT